MSADCFLSNFASDRSHMRNADGSWKMPPPRYPPIHTEGQLTPPLTFDLLHPPDHVTCLTPLPLPASTESQMNLDDFISMSGGGWGRVFSLDHFLHRFLGVTPTSSAAAAATAASS